VSASQIVFVCALAIALVAVTAFSAAVLGSAVHGGRAAGLGLLGRRSEHARLGRAGFFLHRLTGFGIFAFLCLHILDVGLYSVSPRLYDEVQPLYGSAPLRVFECGLLYAVLFHTANGLRLFAVDVVPLPAAWARRLLQVVLAVCAAVGTAGSARILFPLFA
jgi:succinate dehydrogenase / fumarate reductase cytochrome b subunit